MEEAWWSGMLAEVCLASRRLETRPLLLGEREAKLEMEPNLELVGESLSVSRWRDAVCSISLWRSFSLRSALADDLWGEGCVWSQRSDSAVSVMSGEK